MICPQFFPIVGGYEIAAARLSASLARTGISVVVLTEMRDRTWPRCETREGYEIRRWSCIYRRHLHTVTSTLSFIKFLVFHGARFDVWHVHQYGMHCALAILFGRLLRRPVVMKLTSSTSMGIERALQGARFSTVLMHLHRRVSMCLAVTNETLNEAISFGIPESRTLVIPNGLEPYEFLPSDNGSRAKAKSFLGFNFERMVLSVGRLSQEKNPLGLVRAWSRVIANCQASVGLAVVGDGPQLHIVRRLVHELGLEKTIVFAGWQTVLTNWYRAADVFVVASHLEGLSNTMIEALASGVPVVSTCVSGSSKLLGVKPGGIVINVGDEVSMSEAILKLIHDEDLRSRLAANARRLFEREFSMDRIVEQVLDVYAGLTNPIRLSNEVGE
ncbi:MAG: glycosyltransferase family 4 protein [Pirellulaceae bacterium]